MFYYQLRGNKSLPQQGSYALRDPNRFGDLGTRLCTQVTGNRIAGPVHHLAKSGSFLWTPWFSGLAKVISSTRKKAIRFSNRFGTLRVP